MWQFSAYPLFDWTNTRDITNFYFISEPIFPFDTNGNLASRLFDKRDGFKLTIVFFYSWATTSHNHPHRTCLFHSSYDLLELALTIMIHYIEHNYLQLSFWRRVKSDICLCFHQKIHYCYLVGCYAVPVSPLSVICFRIVKNICPDLLLLVICQNLLIANIDFCTADYALLHPNLLKTSPRGRGGKVLCSASNSGASII